MVDQPEVWKNTTYLIDFIPIHFNPKYFDVAEIQRLFLEKDQTAAQIAKQFETSKSVILGILHRSGVRLDSKVGRSDHPENYRNQSPPDGYKVRNGRLTVNKSEIKICRIVVELRGRRQLSTIEIGRSLEQRGFKNRAGRTIWNPRTIINIFERWKGKL